MVWKTVYGPNNGINQETLQVILEDTELLSIFLWRKMDCGLIENVF